MCLREFPTRPDTNRPAQSQKLARVLKFRLKNLDILYYLSSEGCAGWFVPLLFAYDIRHVFSWPSSYIFVWTNFGFSEFFLFPVFQQPCFWAKTYKWYSVNGSKIIGIFSDRENLPCGISHLSRDKGENNYLTFNLHRFDLNRNSRPRNVSAHYARVCQFAIAS